MSCAFRITAIFPTFAVEIVIPSSRIVPMPLYRYNLLSFCCFSCSSLHYRPERRIKPTTFRMQKLPRWLQFASVATSALERTDPRIELHEPKPVPRGNQSILAKLDDIGSNISTIRH
jgi:hypothetical protein